MAERPKKVQLFYTCLVNSIEPEVGMAVVRLLERLGIEVEVPGDQTCCGQPAYNGGFHDDARAVARQAIAVLHPTEGPIVIPSGSCTDMIVHQYPLLFKDDPPWLEKAREVGSRCRELTQFLVEILGGADLGAKLQAKVAYHASCHLTRGMGIREQPLALLRAVQGLELAELAEHDECCGFGGVFSVKCPEISGRMMDRKLRNVERSGADRLVACDLGCLTHLGGGLSRRGSKLKVQHLAQLLDEALR